MFLADLTMIERQNQGCGKIQGRARQGNELWSTNYLLINSIQSWIHKSVDSIHHPLFSSITYWNNLSSNLEQSFVITLNFLIAWSPSYPGLKDAISRLLQDVCYKRLLRCQQVCSLIIDLILCNVLLVVNQYVVTVSRIHHEKEASHRRGLRGGWCSSHHASASGSQR